MRLQYQGKREESSFVFADFKCSPSRKLLKEKGYYKVLWNKGEHAITITIDAYSILLEKNQVIFCTPLNILDLPKDSDLIAVVFNREFYCIRDHDYEVSCQGLLFYGSSFLPIISLAPSEVVSFESMFHIFKEEFRNKDHIQGEMLRVLLKRLLIMSTRLITANVINASVSKPQIDLVRKFHILVENHFREKHKVAAYAELLNKSPKTLSNVFKKTSDDSPLQIINKRIILEAKRLLMSSSKNVDEIGYELGYKESAHFSKFFKSHTGVPPTKFKETYLLGKYK
ncbi:AraC family transcriptional regulator [uncultured Dokdonia sp.]|uniref:helix-turn-helix domain-containing protein n=1 Tax=uncultured Dokdonia sp. TaxID=575653 RepID=UPI0026187191|nr:AraC family transcriptional regulator [uncultured Dokdonia sp.]